MKHYRLLIALACVAVTTPVVAGVPPTVPALENDHPLSSKQVGDLLISELRCAACHGEHTDLGFSAPPAPSLNEVRSRVSIDFLRRYIADPGATDPGTTMPNVLDHLPESQRDSVAADLADYLQSLGTAQFKVGNVDSAEVARGKKLFHRVGCVACHNPRDKDESLVKLKGSVSLSHVEQKYGLQSLADFLFRPHDVRPGGRMPDMRLSRREATQIASYLIGKSKSASPAHQPDPVRVARGKTAFAEHGCAACHALPSQQPKSEPKPAPRWSAANSSRGCLDPKSKTTPRYRLSKEQTDAIRATIGAGPTKLDDRSKLNLTLAAFNCTACHTRAGFSGPTPERNPHFTTDEPNLGDHGRIPPTLDLAGAKFKTLWLQKVLFDAEVVRPYMHTRMPQFGEANTGHLPALFKRTDRLDPVDIPEPSREERRTLRDAGNRLLGDKGLNCVTCHNFNGLESPGFKGMDLMTTFERLEPAWFDRFMRSPGAMRPGIVMPTYWPDGKAVRTDVLDANTEQQIRALWYTFSLGRSAGTPSGMRHVGTKLVVTDKARVYRGRSRIAGYRGIAVGLPGGVNYAFNAETGALSGLWAGEFVSVNWNGQAAGNFNPAARAVSLPQDVSFYRLTDVKAAWPLRPVMTKEQPVNPDPLYPRNRGYRFLGYQLEDGVPTFRYHSDDLRIADRSTVLTAGDRRVLQRTLRFSTPKAQTVWFRALTGSFESNGSAHRLGKLTLTLPQSSLIDQTTVRPFEKAKELLVKLRLPAGESSLEIQYALEP